MSEGIKLIAMIVFRAFGGMLSVSGFVAIVMGACSQRQKVIMAGIAILAIGICLFKMPLLI